MSGHKGNILVVDDEPLLREVVREEFELVGYSVKEAANGRDAFRLISQTAFDAVVSDVRMPGGDGVELLDNIRGMPEPRPLVYMITGFADLTEAAAVAKGAQRLFTKPMPLDQLVSAVADGLARRRAG